MWGEVGGVALGSVLSVGMAALTIIGPKYNDEGQGPIEMVEDAWDHGYTLATASASWSIETEKRADEMQADERALVVLEDAGYPPRSLVSALSRLRASTRHRDRMKAQGASCLLGPDAVLEARIQRLQRLLFWGREPLR